MAEENKFIASRTSVGSPFPKYRSVKYKVALSSVKKMSKTLEESAAQKKVHLAGRQSWRKPCSYSQHRKANSSLSNPAVPEEAEQGLKLSYLSTWDMLLTSPIKAQTVERQQSKLDVLRVHLPAIVNFEPSKFTALDPLCLPFEDIQRAIQEVKAAIPIPQKQLARIRHEMADFEAKMLSDLEHTERHGLRELKRLKELLRTDSVESQGESMRLKRQCASLSQEYSAYRLNFQAAKPRVDVLQEEIFSSQPFSLVCHQHFEQQFPQQYF